MLRLKHLESLPPLFPGFRAVGFHRVDEMALLGVVEAVGTADDGVEV